MKKSFISLLVCCLAFTATNGQANMQSIDSSEVAFAEVEQEASFPGGAEVWRMYLQKNLKASIPIKKKAPAGTYMVIVRFIVDKTGDISSVIPETSFGYGMEKEVVRVIKKGPKWIPAMQEGRIVKAYRRQPITFIVSEE